MMLLSSAIRRIRSWGTPPEPPRWHWRRRSSLRWPPPATGSVDEKGRKATYSIPILTFRLKIKRKTCSSPILMVSSEVSLVVPLASKVSTTESCLEYRVPSWCNQWSRGGGEIIAWCSTWRTPSPLMLILVLAWDILSNCSWRVASFDWDLFGIFWWEGFVAGVESISLLFTFDFLLIKPGLTMCSPWKWRKFVIDG